MPTYDLKCIKCNHVFEYTHTKDKVWPKCPECSGTTEITWRSMPAWVGKPKPRPYDFINKRIPSNPTTVGPHLSKPRKNRRKD